MLEHVSSALFLAIPLAVSGTLHMVIVKLDWFSALRVPINEKRFGANKTWRGVVVMIATTILGVVIAQAVETAIGAPLPVSLRGSSALVLGTLLGAAYVLAELPNSWIKRRLGIASGQLPERKRLLFAFIDQADSAVGCIAVYAVMLRPPLATLAMAALIGPIIHLGANVGLYFVGLRKRPV